MNTLIPSAALWWIVSLAMLGLACGSGDGGDSGDDDAAVDDTNGDDSEADDSAVDDSGDDAADDADDDFDDDDTGDDSDDDTGDDTDDDADDDTGDDTGDDTDDDADDDTDDDTGDDSGDDTADDDFAEDPIVFVHGFVVDSWEWDVMKDRFRALGYPDEALWAISFSSTIQSSRINARDELAPYVDQVLAATGAERVDIIAHSMGGLSTRLWIKSYGGGDKVRDYVSLSGTHHGTIMSCLVPWFGEGAAETCPAYADQADSVNLVQWELNGDPDSADVDETPFGVEDGGGIYWNALRTDSDVLDVPANTCCLNQTFRGDCSDPLNVEVHGVGHIEMAYDEGVFDLVQQMVRAHNPGTP